MNLPDLERLEALAEKATPGPWFTGYAAIHSEPLNNEYMRIEREIPDDAPEEAYERLPDTSVCHVPVVGGDTPTAQGARDAAFIAAASPDVVLALVARVRELDGMTKAGAYWEERAQEHRMRVRELEEALGGALNMASDMWRQDPLYAALRSLLARGGK